MNTPKIQAVLYRNKKYTDGSHPIMIRITQNRKAIYKSIGYSVLPDAWDEENYRVYEKKPLLTKKLENQFSPQKIAELKIRYPKAIVVHNARHINIAIKDKIDEISDINEKLKVNDEGVDLKNIKSKLNPNVSGDRNKSFLVFGKEYRDSFFKASSIGTYKSYKSIIKKIEDYYKKDLLFSDVNVQFLEDYEAHLKSIENKKSTIHKNLKAIRAVYYKAIAQKIITAENNPFFVFKLHRDDNAKKDKLTIEEIIKLEKLDLEKGSIIFHSRNFFLFSFYCAGIRVGDVLQLKWCNINSDGRLEYAMDKTDHPKSISLIPKTEAILKYYKTKKTKPIDFIFPFIDPTSDIKNPVVLYNQISSCTAIINDCLKDIATTAKIKKNISTHIARHSFSDIARKRGTSIYDISKMLGHTSIKMTEVYLAGFDVDSQDENMKSILDF